MEKISFEMAKKALQESKLLVKSFDSLSTQKGSLQTRAESIQLDDFYIAFRGTRVDAHDFISEALQKKAQCIILDDANRLPLSPETPFLLVSDARAAWSILTALSFGNPENHMNLYGVTGTDGKTSTVWMASELIRHHHKKCLSLGTLGAFDGDEHWVLHHTTPDPPVFFSTLAQSVKNKTDTVVMEVSSHSLIQRKLENIYFNAAIFTSFSRDHLDFHKTIEEYFEAKCLLFTEHLNKNAKIILCEKLLSSFPIHKFNHEQIWIYGSHLEPQSHHMKLLESKPGEHGQFIKIQFKDKIYSGEIPYLGIHNAENFMAALLLTEDILKTIPDPKMWMKLTPIPGRCERIKIKKPSPRVYIDFAHTPEGLKTTLSTLRMYTEGKLWVVFGCGGDRDHGKRPAMAQIAETHADLVIMTSDNPRSEKIEDILEDMKKGLNQSSFVHIISDRELAIRYAIQNAESKDIILIAGKGHEDYQMIGSKKIPFRDQAHAQHYLDIFWGKK
jgi:UDP-N-acetylmuramoyl-L-alanyl-D-glutamate--2,6-diaminopimelate ligase